MSSVFDTPQGHQPSDLCAPLGTKNDENSISVRLSLSVATCFYLNSFIPAPLHSFFFYFPSFTISFHFRSLVHISSDWESKAETHDKTTHSWDVLFMRVGYLCGASSYFLLTPPGAYLKRREQCSTRDKEMAHSVRSTAVSYLYRWAPEALF